MQYPETSPSVSLGVGPCQAAEELSMPWQQALEAAGDGVWDWDVRNDRMRYCGRLAAMLGHDPVVLGGTRADAGRLQHPDDRAEVSMRLDKHVSAQWPVYVAEYRMRCADGSYKWILARGQVTERDAEGRALRMVGTHADTTLRKLRELELLGFSNELTDTRTWVPDRMVEMDLQGRLVDSAAWSDVIGSDLAAGLTWPEVDLPLMRRALQEAAQTGTSCGHRYPLEGPAGHRWQEVSVYRRNRLCEGQQRFLVVIRDVTRQKALEDELRIVGKVFESQQAMVLIDTTHTVVRVNQALCELLGYERQALMGRKAWEILQGSRLEKSDQSSFWGDLQARGDFEEEITLMRGNGELVTLWYSITLVQDDDGVVTHYAGLVSDVTERRRRREEQVAQNLAQRHALVREVHHRIKNNLQGIVGILRAFGHHHPDTLEAINHAVSQVQSVAVIHGLQGRSTLEQVRLCELSSSIAQGVGALFQTEIGMDIPSPWQPCLLATSEAVPVALILNELMLNAVKHRRDPHSQVTVSLRKGESEDQVQLSIFNVGAWQPVAGDEHVGLGLVELLMPRAGARLTHCQSQQGVNTMLVLGAPVISSLPGEYS